MKRSLGLALLLLPFLPDLAQAQCNSCTTCAPWLVKAKLNFSLRIVPKHYTPAGQLGPWYLYWPMEAHFQTPPPLPSYPYWPAGGGYAAPGYGVPGPQLTPAPVAGGPAQFHAPSPYTGGYAQAPPYWYGR